MEPPIFYAPADSIRDNMIELSSAEARHLVAVMRLQAGAVVLVVDGLGMAYRGEVAAVSQKSATVRIISQHRNFGEPMVRLTLAAGFSTGGKFDNVVQRGTELGVKRFVPVVAEKGKVNPSDPKRVRNRVGRLEQVALAAIKQCRRSYRPDISLPMTLSELLTETDPESCNLLFHPAAASRPLDADVLNPDAKRVTVLVGPESGFTGDEVRRAVTSGFTLVSLGARVLRTETAGPVACALVMQALGELR